MKQWVTVATYRGYEIQILDGAEVGDPMDYRTNPPLPGQDHDCNCPACTFSTVVDAMTAIDRYNPT
jgi:hypothetical protein